METKQELSLKEALNKINELGYKYIRFNYNGAGDSGSTDRPDFYRTKEEATFERLDGCSWNQNYQELTKNFKECQDFVQPLQTKVDKVLTDIEDWWNNDGGFGHIIINTETGEYTIENNINIVDQETYNHEGKIE
jgi:hypothetical protein